MISMINIRYLILKVIFILLKVTFEITGEQMQVWTTEWVIPSGEMKVSVGGQQPNQKTRVPSNILEGNFSIK